jgi:hypothetical protein
VRLGAEFGSEARLADARFAGDQDRGKAAALDPRPRGA